MVLRQACMADLGAVQRITHSAYAPYEASLGGKPLPMTEDHAARIERREVWMAERDGAAVGVMVVEAAEDHLMIFSLAIPPEWQGQGLGRQLIQAAEAQARAARVPMLRLYTNDRMTRNIAIYQKAGFQETGRRPNPARPGWTLVDMAKRVPASAGGSPSGG